MPIIRGLLKQESAASAPVSPAQGQMYWDTTLGKWQIYNGTAWQDVNVGPPPVVTSNLLVHLDAGDNASYPGTGTTWTDLTGNGYHGTLTNGPTYDSANSGSIVTDGTDDYIKINSVAGTGTSTQSQTYEVWINPSDNDGNIMYMSANSDGSGWNMPPMAASSGNFRGKIWNNNFLTSTSSFTQGNWYQVVLVFDNSAGTQELFVNSTSNASQSSISYTSSGVNNYVWLGAANSGSDNTGFLAAKYGIWRIYDKALSSSEVTQNWNANRTRYGL